MFLFSSSSETGKAISRCREWKFYGPLTWCCDSRLRCRWQRDRHARAQGRFQRVV